MIPPLHFEAKLHLSDEHPPIDLQCEVTLPSRVYDRPTIVFLPEQDINRYYEVDRYFKVNKRYRFSGVAGSWTVDADGVLFGAGHQRHIGPGKFERHIKAHAECLRVASPVEKREEKDIVATFILTDSFLLKPFSSMTCHSNGSVDVEEVGSLSFDLNEALLLTFQNTFLFEKRGHEHVSWSVLKATATLKERFAHEIIDRTKLIEEFDDFLLLASLGEGRRIASLEVIWHEATRDVHEYRLNRAVPPQKTDHSWKNCEISNFEDFKEFLKVSVPTLNAHPEKYLIRRALAAMTNFDDATLETEFLRAFSAFESIVLAHRRTNSLEFSVKDSDERKSIEQNIQTTLKTHPALSGKSKSTARCYIYENLKGIFRISLSQAATDFFNFRGIYHSDIWPIFGGDKSASLVDIRNRLAHGDSFKQVHFENLIAARNNLVTMVHRCLFKSLGFQYEKSRSAVDYRINVPAWKDLHERLREDLKNDGDKDSNY